MRRRCRLPDRCGITRHAWCRAMKACRCRWRRRTSSGSVRSGMKPGCGAGAPRSCGSVPYGISIGIAGVAGAETAAALQVDLNTFTITDTAPRDAVAVLLQQIDGIGGESGALQHNAIRHPLLVEARCVHRLLDIEAVVLHVDEDVGHRRDDGRATW